MNTQPLKKIIVVDDDEDILLVTEFALEGLKDVEKKFCKSAQEGIKEALAFHPDLMVIDVMMPDMDGIAMTKLMKENPLLKDIPVVFFTAKIQQNEIEQYVKTGILDVIIKPFDPLKFSQRILDIWTNMNDQTQQQLYNS